MHCDRTTANIYRHEPLTLSEYNRLGQLKKGLGKLLKTIREEEIASVVTFSLTDRTIPANETQLIEAAESTIQEKSAAKVESVAREETCSRDDSSVASSSATFVNCRIQEDSPMKQESVSKESLATFLLY